MEPTLGRVSRGKMDADKWRLTLLSISNDLEDEYLDEVIRRYRPAMIEDEEEEEADTFEKTKQKFLKMMDQDSDDLKTMRRLHKVFDDMNLHTLMKGKLADIVQQFIETEVAFRKNFVNDTFIGRDVDRTLVCDKFSTKEGVYGINIWGLGGQGKSSLAKTVCTTMMDNGWSVVKVDLRLTDNTTGMVKAILVGCRETCPQHDDRRQLMDMVGTMLENVTSDTLFFLDNCDKILDNDKRGLTRFLEKAFGEARNSGKMLFLLTSRQQLWPCWGDMLPRRSTSRFTQGAKNRLPELAEYQLRSLAEPEAVQLFKAVAGTEDVEEQMVLEIVTTCGCSPHAINMAASLVKDGRYTLNRLVAHLKLDQKNITKALHMSDLMKEAVESLQPELQKALVKLSLFPNTQFDLPSACRVLAIPVSSENKEAKEVLRELHQKHLIECENKLGSISDHSRDKKIYFSLHPLVHRYLSEWRKPADLEQAFNDAVRSFMELYEEKINKIVRKMDTKGMKGIEMLQEHKSHVIQYYDIMHDKVELLRPYPKKVGSKEVLSMKRVSDLTDLILSDVMKRRLFQSEADRAKRCGCDAMYAFWMVEKADVLLMLHDKPELAKEILDDLTNGKFAALRGLHPDCFYPPIVHALFHKVKGLVFWKLDSYEPSLKHMELCLQFYKKRESRVYDHLMAKIHCYMGQIYLDNGEIQHAEKCFTKGFRMIMGLESNDDDENMDPELDMDIPRKKKLQWEVPLYYAFFGRIKLNKARQDPTNREKLLDKAQEDLLEGMELDRQLKLEKLDNYCLKLRLLAEVFAEKGVTPEAIRYAEAALNQRRLILQPPHIKYVNSCYQVARLHMRRGNELKADGKTEEAMDSWITSFGYFNELKKCYLIDGSIAVDNPLVKTIKSDHMEVARLAGEDVRKIAKFYKDLFAGCYTPEASSRLQKFKEMLWTPFETVKKAFGMGGDEFGEHDYIIEKIEDEAREQMDEMIQAAEGDGGPARRRDSGMGHSSSDLGDSLSSAGSSLSGNLGRLRLEKSVSLEDNVFTESTEVKTTAKPEKKRQRTIDE